MDILENFYVDMWYHFREQILRYGSAELRRYQLTGAAAPVFPHGCLPSRQHLLELSLPDTHTNTNYCPSSQLNILVGLKWYLTELPSCILLSHYSCICMYISSGIPFNWDSMASWFLHVTRAITCKFRRWTWDNQYFLTWTETNPREVCRIRKMKQKWARIEYHGDLKGPVMSSVLFLSLNCFFWECATSP